MSIGFHIKTQVAGSPLTLVPNSCPFFPTLLFSRNVEEITEGMSYIGPGSCIP